MPPAVGIAVYRMAQEALANVARHAQASRVRLTLAAGDGELVAEVQDDGRGLPAAPVGGRAAPGRRPAPRLGLFAAQERIGLVGGRFAVELAPGQGTTVRASVPLPRPRPAALARVARRAPLGPSPRLGWPGGAQATRR